MCSVQAAAVLQRLYRCPKFTNSRLSRVQKCRLHSGFKSYVKTPEFLGRFRIIELFTFFFIRLNTFMQLAAFRRYPGIAGSEEVYSAVAICLAAVSNRLKCSPNGPRKAFLKPHETIISLFRNVKRFQKSFWFFQ